MKQIQQREPNEGGYAMGRGTSKSLKEKVSESYGKSSQRPESDYGTAAIWSA